MMPMPVKLIAENFVLTVEFSDGQIRQIDVRTFLGKGTNTDEIKKSLALFKTAQIEDDIAITWKNGFSLDPDAVYDEGVNIKSLPITGVHKKIQSHYKRSQRS